MTDLKPKGFFGALVIFPGADFKLWRIRLVNISVGMVLEKELLPKQILVELFSASCRNFWKEPWGAYQIRLRSKYFGNHFTKWGQYDQSPSICLVAFVGTSIKR